MEKWQQLRKRNTLRPPALIAQVQTDGICGCEVANHCNRWMCFSFFLANQAFVLALLKQSSVSHSTKHPVLFQTNCFLSELNHHRAQWGFQSAPCAVRCYRCKFLIASLSHHEFSFCPRAPLNSLVIVFMALSSTILRIPLWTPTGKEKKILKHTLTQCTQSISTYCVLYVGSNTVCCSEKQERKQANQNTSDL